MQLQPEHYLCFGKTYILSNGWNKSPTEIICEGDKKIVHYNLYKKPWQYDDVIDGEYFWEYAKLSPFYELILDRKAMFGEKEKTSGDVMAREILLHADRIVASDNTFAKILGVRG